MIEFTFIEFANEETGESRHVAFRAPNLTNSSLRHLDRFTAGRDWTIMAMYAATGETFRDARAKVEQFITVYRNPEMPQELLA